MTSHSEQAACCPLYVHVRSKPKGAWMLARVRGNGAEFLISPDYPAEFVDAAIAYLGYMLDGVFMTSLCEWWAVYDHPPAEVLSQLGTRQADLPSLVAEAWAAHDASTLLDSRVAS